MLNEQPSYKRGVARPIPDVIYYSNHAAANHQGPALYILLLYTLYTHYTHTIHTILVYIYVTEGTCFVCTVVSKMAYLPISVPVHIVSNIVSGQNARQKARGKL